VQVRKHQDPHALIVAYDEQVARDVSP